MTSKRQSLLIQDEEERCLDSKLPPDSFTDLEKDSVYEPHVVTRRPVNEFSRSVDPEDDLSSEEVAVRADP